MRIQKSNIDPTPTLYLVPTPIGNFDDMTYRAVETLSKVDLIAAEDTRHTLKLLNHFEIAKPLISYHRHNEEIKSEYLIEKLKNGENIHSLIQTKQQLMI